MEHIVQFGISIDDNAIKNTVLRNVQSQVTGDIIREVKDTAMGKAVYDKSEWKKFLDSEVTKLVESHIDEMREDIIDRAAAKLADKLSRSKAIRDKLNVLLDTE